MGKTFSINPEELETASKKIAEIADEYSSASTKMFDCANTMGQAWESEDNLAFVDQINGLVEDLNNMVNKLRSASENLETQRKNYVDRMNDNLEKVRTLTN